MEAIKSSEVWRSTLGKGNNDELNSLMRTMPADVAILTYISQHPDLREAIELERFPKDAITRSTFLDPSQVQMNYEERLQTLREAGFAFLYNFKTGREDTIYQMLKSNSECRGAFAKILMNNTLYGCLLNNINLGGDLDYCFFDYFSRYPDDFRMLANAFRASQESESCISPARAPTTSSDNQAMYRNLKPQRQASSPVQEKRFQSAQVPRGPYQGGSAQIYMIFDSRQNLSTQEQIRAAKTHVETLKKESSIKSLNINKLQQALIDTRDELSTVRRACGYQYQPTSQWCETASPHTSQCGAPRTHPDKLIVPYQSLTFAEVPTNDIL